MNGVKNRCIRMLAFLCCAVLVLGGCGVANANMEMTDYSEAESVSFDNITNQNENKNVDSTEDIKDNKSPSSEVVITVGVMNEDILFSPWIVDFNKAHPEIAVKVKNYGENGFEEGIVRLNADIVAGKAPDILDLSDLDIGPYIDKGVFTDLYVLLDADEGLNREDFIQNVLKIYEKDEKLYGIAAGFYLETLMCKSKIISDSEQWTFQKMESMIKNLSNQEELIDNLAPLGMLRIALQMETDRFIDWESGKCRFNSDEFINLMKLANSLQQIKQSNDTDEQKIKDDRLKIIRGYIYTIEDYVTAIDMFQGDSVTAIGYPSEDGGHGKITTYLSFGIMESCKNKEAAWEFVKSFLSKQFQEEESHFHFPILKSVLDARFESEQNKIESGVGIQRVATEEEIKDLQRIIESCVGKSSINVEIWNIISEEALGYFEGEKSLEDVTDIIQNRVNIYVSENQ